MAVAYARGALRVLNALLWLPKHLIAEQKSVHQRHETTDRFGIKFDVLVAVIVLMRCTLLLTILCCDA